MGGILKEISASNVVFSIKCRMPFLRNTNHHGFPTLTMHGYLLSLLRTREKRVYVIVAVAWHHIRLRSFICGVICIIAIPHVIPCGV